MNTSVQQGLLGGRQRASRLALVAALSASALAGCQSMPAGGTAASTGPDGCKRLAATTNNENAAIGAAAGAVLGAVIGSKNANTKSVGARNGALVGAVGGAIAGSQFNKLIGVTEMPDGAVKLNIPGSVMFRSGSAEISPDFGSTLNSVASTVREYCGLTATVVGYTDNVGSVDMNLRLSNERARSVTTYLTHQGVRADRLQAEGRGMADPVGPNSTELGRAQNRRVEVFVRQGPG